MERLDFAKFFLLCYVNRKRKKERLKVIKRKMPEIEIPPAPSPPIGIPLPPPPPLPPKLPEKKLSLGKITKLINNPEVDLIRCDGPLLPITIRKSGVIQTIPIKLDFEEIKAILNEFSKLTETEIKPPMFISTYENLRIIAFISKDSIRFVIERI